MNHLSAFAQHYLRPPHALSHSNHPHALQLAWVQVNALGGQVACSGQGDSDSDNPPAPCPSGDGWHFREGWQTKYAKSIVGTETVLA